MTDVHDPALVSSDLGQEHAAHAQHVAAAATSAASSRANAANARERHSLTLDQRRSLRRWAYGQPVRPSHKACINWFFTQFGQQISQSTVSHSLSPKYSRLDAENPQLSGSRLRFGNWPDVEKMVLLWYQQVQASGRQPTNEELGDKAKAVFSQLPRYKDETAPEFSPGWIHRFKKRYGLLVRRQRRHGDDAIDPAEDIEYLADCVPRVMAIHPDTNPSAIKEQVLRVVGVEASLNTCALVRDEVIRRLSGTSSQQHAHVVTPMAQFAPPPPDPPTPPPPPPNQPMYAEDDPEVVLQNALRQLQQEEQAAEEQAAAVREEHHHVHHAGPPARASSSDARYATPAHDMPPDLTLTPIHSDGPVSSHERPLRCPFCVNQRMLRTIKEAVEHMSTHVVV
ncbi:pogo transposase / Cenp-B / PDC2, DNA-binding HTH domain-containingprotein [Purpureocillium lavendulum]|uniref:Pogo transposase / Cenp-B / PDC2, DNA-binding HTH domain-containingprotein n=1 Tax=Purpureocillium lavendulum TaxID=1247861 RepID=A0AB34G828_9HYPO|nr:pogo transposase / Cenp-B / PDC2, DNA-binding HTH domain-containingprotein [Purpureocillium lavendulum]